MVGCGAANRWGTRHSPFLTRAQNFPNLVALMKLLQFNESNFDLLLKEVTRTSSLFNEEIENRTRGIVDSVRIDGDAALIELTHRFDKASLTPSTLAVSASELAESWRGVPAPIKSAMKLSHRNVTQFARQSMRKAWQGKNDQGAKVGEKFDPFHRVGIYVPGGTAPLASTVIMTVALAKAAGCPEIVVMTPCGADGSVNPYLLAACHLCGATEVYRVGGAQAIAAMALGTATIRKVQKIFGPGNAYVVAAKRLLFGHVSMDLLPGPSELLVLSDSTARADWIAADLLAQAEHGSTHERVFLVSTSLKIIKDVNKHIDQQSASLKRKEYIAKTLKDNGFALHVKSLEMGIRLTNALAPEHCEVMLKDPRAAIKSIQTAGAIFVGGLSPTALGDYLAGPSHVLPTGGAGLSFAGLTVDQFQRRTSIVEFNRAALEKSVPALQVLAGLEGLDAHARSGAIRLES